MDSPILGENMTIGWDVCGLNPMTVGQKGKRKNKVGTKMEAKMEKQDGKRETPQTSEETRQSFLSVPASTQQNRDQQVSLPSPKQPLTKPAWVSMFLNNMTEAPIFKINLDGMGQFLFLILYPPFVVSTAVYSCFST